MGSYKQEVAEARAARSVWEQAHRLLEQYQHRPGKADILLEGLPDRLDALQRRRIQSLFMSAIRHALWIEHVLGRYLKRPPKSRLRALLHLACAEMRLREAGERAAVTDYAVEQAKRLCSKPEAAMVNAVLRKIVVDADEASLARLPLHLRYSHPRWLVERWTKAHSRAIAEQWLQFNQQPPEITLRLFGELSGEPPAGLESTPWEGFVRAAPGRWDVVQPLIAQGMAYVQDPSTRLPVSLLKPRSGERILDLCAAPGGKSVAISRALGQSGRLVAVDLPGRVKRLRENLERVGAGNHLVIEGDGLKLDELLEARGEATPFDAVLLDAPCSNTGVLRRRPDAKWRLRPEDIPAMTELQGELLLCASRQLKSGGRLVYSTCSVEPEENAGVAQAFLEACGGAFRLEESLTYTPEQRGHDGGGACCFVRQK